MKRLTVAFLAQVFVRAWHLEKSNRTYVTSTCGVHRVNMASSLNVVDALMPKASEQHDQRLYAKASTRYKEIMSKHGLPHGSPEKVRVPCNEILPSPFNRMGRYLNVPYIHNDLVPNIGNKGYQVSRAAPGLLVRRTKPDTLERLHKHARNMIAYLGALLPPIDITYLQNKECIGGNHLTVSVRCYRQNFYCSLSKFQAEIPKDDDDLKLTADKGHYYFELDDETSDADAEFLSELLNSDQNQNQINSEDHLRGLVQKHVTALLTIERPIVATSIIIERVMKESVVKLKPDNIGDIAAFVIDLYDVAAIAAGKADRYMQELGWRYSHSVNPRELTVSARMHAEISRLIGKHRPLTKLAAMFVMYRGLVKTEQTRPMPDVSRSLDVPLLTALSVDKTKLDEHEEMCRSNREKFEGYLLTNVGVHRTASLFNEFEEATMRLLCGKSLVVGFPHGVSGKWSPEKARTLQAAWVPYCASAQSTLEHMPQLFGIGHNTTAEEQEVPIVMRHVGPTFCFFVVQVCVHSFSIGGEAHHVWSGCSPTVQHKRDI